MKRPAPAWKAVNRPGPWSTGLSLKRKSRGKVDTGIRYLHRAAGCAVPTDDVAVSETLAGIHRQAARQGQTPRKKVAATAGILRQILVRYRTRRISGACATAPRC